MQLAHAKRGGDHVNLCPDPQGASLYGNFWPTSVFDVEDYGAVHDGETDDVWAVQAAINECSAAGGGYVYMPAGEYYLYAGHNANFYSIGCLTELRNGVHVIGDGPGATIIANGRVSVCAFAGGYVDNVGVQDMSQYTIPPTVGSGEGIKLGGCTNVYVSNFVGGIGGSCMGFYGCNDVLIEDCIGSDCDTYCFAFSSHVGTDTYVSGTNNVIRNCEAYGSPAAFGFRLGGGGRDEGDRQADVTIENCYSHDNNYGFGLTWAEDSNLTDCVAEDNVSHNVYIGGSRRIDIHNMTYSGTGGSSAFIVTNANNPTAFAVYGDSTDIVED